MVTIDQYKTPFAYMLQVLNDQEKAVFGRPAVSTLQEMIGRWAEEKGWQFTEADIPEKLCLMHSEISEALEEYRKDIEPTLTYYSESGKPEGIPAEMADIVIRVMQFCAGLGIDLNYAIIEKMAYNETRPYRHGKKI